MKNIEAMTISKLRERITYWRTRATRCHKAERSADCIAAAQLLEEELERRRTYLPLPFDEESCT